MPCAVTDRSLLEALRIGCKLDELHCPAHKERIIGTSHADMFVIAFPGIEPKEFTQKELFAFHAALDHFMRRHK